MLIKRFDFFFGSGLHYTVRVVVETIDITVAAAFGHSFCFDCKKKKKKANQLSCTNL